MSSIHSSLQNDLQHLSRSDPHANPAFNTLVSDYARYHLVLVIVGGAMAVVLLALGAYFLARLMRTRRSAVHKSSLERTAFGSLGIVLTISGLLMLLIVAANATNAVHPTRGLVGSVGTPKAGTATYRRYQTFESWMQSGKASTPHVIGDEVRERLSWQRPKAIICTVLLIGAAVASTLSWRTLLKRSRRQGTTFGMRDAALLVSGVAAVAVSLLLVVMVVANTQATFAPLTLTMLYG